MSVPTHACRRHTVEPENDPPYAYALTYFTAPGVPVAVTLTAGDAETPASLSYNVPAQPTYGVVTGTGVNRTYTPPAPGPGTSSIGTGFFKYTVSDGIAAPTEGSVTVYVGQGGPPTVFAGADQTIYLYGSCFLAGVPNAVSGNLRLAWSTASGPAQVSFGSPAQGLTSAAGFQVPGVYTLRFSQYNTQGTPSTTDDVLIASDDMSVTVLDNNAPNVNAGPDLQLPVGSAPSLTGTVVDDWTATWPILQWYLLSAPEGYSYTPPAGATVTLSALNLPGIYVLRFTAQNGGDVGSDEMIIQVFDTNGRTWTRDGDWEEGYATNVEYDSTPGSLTLAARGAFSTRMSAVIVGYDSSKACTLLRVDSDSGKVVASHLVGPGRGRTALSTLSLPNGDTLVSARFFGGNGSASPMLIRYGSIVGGTRVQGPSLVEDPLGEYLRPPFRYSTMKDRPGGTGSADGLIRTSGGSLQILPWTDVEPAGNLYSAQEEIDLLAAAQDEAIVQVRCLRYPDNSQTPAIDAPIGIQMDSAGFLWVLGLMDDGSLRLAKLDPETLAVIGVVVPTGDCVLDWSPDGLQAVPGSGNTFVVAKSGPGGIGWARIDFSSGSSAQCVCGSDPPHASVPEPPGTASRSIAVDPTTGTIWTVPMEHSDTMRVQSNWAFSIDPDGLTENDRGDIVVGRDGHAWLLPYYSSAPRKVAHLNSAGEPVGTLDLGCLGGSAAAHTGVDGRGRIWVSASPEGIESEVTTLVRLVRIDPTRGPVTDSGSTRGDVDLTSDVWFPEEQVYGWGAPFFVPDTINLRDRSLGTWIAVHSNITSTAWGKVVWTADTPSGSSLKVEARAAASQPLLASANWITVANGASLGQSGKCVEVRVTFSRGASGAPVLHELSIRPNLAPDLSFGVTGEIARDDEFRVPQGNGGSSLNVLANDSLSGLVLREPVGQPHYGTTKIVSGQIVYTPQPGFFGEDRFTYTATKAGGVIDRALVRIAVSTAVTAPSILPPATGEEDDPYKEWRDSYGPRDVAGVCQAPPAPGNHAPIAVSDIRTKIGRVLATDTSELDIDVLANDYDLDANDQVSLIDDFPRRTMFGRVRRVGDVLKYQPDVFGYGADRFTYTVRDRSGTNSTGNVTVYVVPVSPPTLTFAVSPAGPSVPQPATLTLTATVNPGQVDTSAFANDFFFGLATGRAFPEGGTGGQQLVSPKIVRVEFFDRDRKIGEVLNPSTSTAQITWTKVPAGTHSLTASVTDALGLSANSEPVLKTVNRSAGTAGNQGPAASITGFNSVHTEPPGGVTSEVDPGSGEGRPRIVKAGRPDFIFRAGDDTIGDTLLSYQILLYRPDGTLVANVTPGTLTAGYNTTLPKTGTIASPQTFTQAIDLTPFANGGYELELRVNDGVDEIVTPRFPLVLRTGLKLGPFTYQEEDTLLSTAGLPLTIVRTYDSSSTWDGDVGYGWTFAVNDLNVEFNEDREITTDFFSDETFSMRTGGGRDVTLTLPDGRRTTFVFEVKEADVPIHLLASWRAEPGVSATLSTPSPGDHDTVGDNSLITLPVPSGDFNYWQAGGPACPSAHFDVPKYLLKLEDGTVYTIEREDLGSHDVKIEPGRFIFVPARGKARVTRVDRPTGEYLAISPTGIDHYLPDGQKSRSLYFERGVANRIVNVRDASVTNPSAAPLVHYEYDGDGNLIHAHKLRDRATSTYATTTYAYEVPAYPHHLTKILDARGVPMARNTYYPAGDSRAGKLQTVTAADNRVTTFDYLFIPSFNPTAANRGVVALQRITDHEGRITEHEVDAQGNVLLSKNALNVLTERWFDTLNNLTTETVKPTYSSPGLSHGFTLQYDTPANPNRVKNRVILQPGSLARREDYDTLGQVRYSVDNRYYLANQPPNAAAFYHEFDYDTSGRLLRTWARGSGAPATPLETLAYHPTSGLLQRRWNAMGHRTTYVYFGADAGADGRPGDLKEMIEESVQSPTFSLAAGWSGTYATLTKATYKYDPVTGRRVEETRYKLSGGSWVAHAVTKYSFDAQGRVAQVIDPTDAVSSTTYDANGSIRETTDRFGGTTRYTYDATGRLAETQFADQTVARSAVRYVAYPPGGTRILRHEIQEDPHLVVDATSATQTIFDEVGRPIRQERLANVVINMSLAGEVATTTFVSGTVQSASETRYDYADRVELASDTNGKWTYNEYDEFGRKWRTRAFVNAAVTPPVNSPDTLTTIQDYDKNGNLVWTLDARQRDLITATIPDTTPTLARQWIVSNHKGRLAKFDYDNFGRQTKAKLPDDNTPNNDTDDPYSQTAYDLAGLKWLAIDPDRKATATVYDALGRLIWVVQGVATSPQPPTSLPAVLPTTIAGWTTWANNGSAAPADTAVTRYDYDELGNLKSQTSAESQSTTFEYDKLGRRTKRTLPSTLFEEWIHDYDTVSGAPATGAVKPNRVVHKDFLTPKRQTLLSYNLRGRLDLAQVLVGSTWTTTRDYDYAPAGQRSRMLDNNSSRQTRYAYDGIGRLKIKQTPEGTLSYSYNTGGQLTDISARHAYTFPTTKPWLYAEDRQTSNTRPSGAHMAYWYDGRNRLWKVFGDPAQSILRATYGYDANGNLTTLAYDNPTALSASYQYNGRNHLRAISAVGGSTTLSFDYDAALAAPQSEGTRPASRLLTKAGVRGGVREVLPSGASTSVRLVGYDYDGLGRLKKEALYNVTWAAESGYARYDDTVGFATATEGLSPVGNRRRRTVSTFSGVPDRTYATYTADDLPGNASTPTAGVVSARFDANGNTLRFDLDASGGASWDNTSDDLYDTDNRLLSGVRPSGSFSMVYDGDGNRVQQTAGGATRCFLVDNLNPTGYPQVIEEFGAEPATGLVGRWRFEEGTGTTAVDDSGGNLNGTLLGGTTRTAGPAGRALHFDGVDDQVSVTSSSQLQLGPNMTIAFWVKKEAEASSWTRLVGKGNDEFRNYGVWEEPGNSKRVFFQIYAVPGSGASMQFYSTSTLELDRWYHVACTYDGTTGRIYIDGAAAGSATGTLTPKTSTDPLTFGYSPGMYGAMQCALDEVLIYNRALAATEVASLAQRPAKYTYGQDLISQERMGAVSYFGYDGLGSVRYLTDASGNVTDTYTYDAFGVLVDRKVRHPVNGLVAFADPTLENGSPSGTTPVINNYRFAGEQWDPNLGMYYLRARYYHPDLGRFWTMDAFEGNPSDPQSLHKYLYAHADPVNMVDPSGHWSSGEVVAAIGIGLNIAFAAHDAVSAAKAGHAGRYLEAAKYDTYFAIDVVLLAVPFGGTGGRGLAYAGRAVNEAELIAAASSKGIKIASWAWAGIRGLIFAQSMDSGDGGDSSVPTGDDSVGRNGAFREAKRDAGIPMNQHPDEVQHKLMTDRNLNPILDKNKQMIYFREYHFTRPDGSKIAIQEHTRGDIAIEQYGSHFNVREVKPNGEVVRNSTVTGTKDHYSFTD